MPIWITNTFNFIKPLLCDDGKLSVGRVGLWILLYKALSVISITPEGTITDIPLNLLYLTIIFVIYNFSKKVDVFVKVANAIWPTGK